MTHSFWFLTCDALAVYRLAILSAKDKITDGGREWLRDRAYDGQARRRRGVRAGVARWSFELVSCPWCISIWLAAGVVALTKFAPGAWQYGAMFLALSGVAGYLAER